MPQNPSHKWLMQIKPTIRKELSQLSKSERLSLFKHLQQLLEAENPYSLPFAQKLREERFAEVRRFRIGDYRVFSIWKRNPSPTTSFSIRGR